MLLLAERTQHASMGRRVRQSTIDVQDLMLCAAWLAAGALIVYGVMFIRSWRSRYHATHASGVFRELCRAHGLNWHDRRLLHALARAQQLETPAQLFVEPQRFAWEKAGSSLQQRIAALRQRLFTKNGTGEMD